MRKSEVKSKRIYTIDLTTIDGEGAFPCPKCGVTVSPDAETEEVYRISETKVKGDELAQLILLCNKCDCKIKLTGFLSQSQEARHK